MEAAESTRIVLMYFIMPLWFAAGFADYLCHRASNIATTAGPKESLLHLAQFAEIGVPIVGALVLEINALLLLVDDHLPRPARGDSNLGRELCLCAPGGDTDGAAR